MLSRWMIGTSKIWAAAALVGVMGSSVLLHTVQPALGQSQVAQSQPSKTTSSFEPITIEGVLDDRHFFPDNNIYLNPHPFEGQSGQQIQIDLMSEEIDTMLVVSDVSEVLATDNNSGGENNARIVMTIPATGNYWIISASENPGSYRLTIQSASEQAVATTAQLAEAESFNQQVLQLVQEGRYGEAILLAERALEIRESVLGAEHPDVATSLNNLAELYREQGNYGAAEPLYQRSLQILETALGEHHPDVATSLNNLALLYHDQGNYGAAEPLFQRSLQIRETSLGENHPDVATSLSNLANLYQAQGNYGAAEPLFQQSLQIRETSLGENHPNVANSLNNLAELYREQGNYGAAEPLFQRSLQIVETSLGEDHPDVAISLNNLALLYHEQGNYGAAEPLYQRSLQIWETALGENHPNVATSLAGLASLYQLQGNYAAAEPLLQRSLQTFETTLGENHPDVAFSLNNLALLYQAQGNYAEAEPLLQRSLQIRETALGENHPDVATSLNNLAELYREQGNYVAAEPLHQRSLQIREAILGENHTDVATSLNNLATVYYDQGNYAEAEQFYQQSLQIMQTALGENHPDVAASLNNLALLHQAQGNHTVAESFLQRSLQIREAVLGETHPDVAASLNNLAGLYRDQESYARAESLFQRSLRIMETTLGNTHPDVAVSLSNLAWLHQAQGNIEQSLTLLHQGMEIEESTLALNLSIGSEKYKQAYLATTASTTSYTISLHLQNTFDNVAAAQLALTTVLRRKGRILDVVTDSFQRLRDNLTPELASLLDEYTATQSQLSNLVYRGLGDQDPAVYRTQLETLQQQAEDLENQLAQRSAEFRIETQPVEIEDIQALIPSDAVLVELVRYYPFDPSGAGSWGEPRYAAYVLHANGEIQWADLGDAATIDAAAFAFLATTQNPISGNRVRTTGRALDELVMEPIRPLLGDATHILLSPDSQLNLIPFAALVDENDRYLMETYTLTHLTTGRDLLRLQNPSPSQQPPVIFANPDYDLANPTEVAALATTRSASIADSERSGDIADLQFGPLPGTQLEVDAIAPLLDNPVILTEAEATENVLQQLQSPAILHIATHGFFLQDVEFAPPETRSGTGTIFLEFTGDPAIPSNNPTSNENPLLRSGLAFAGFNQRDSQGEDGVLTALEAANLDLRGTNLVVMSACETGVGDVANGEGVYGLRRAFVMAGAESQLMSLWKVSDQGTAELMQLYYDRLLSGQERSESLRQVQLELLAAPAYSHPYYWSGFIFSGDWTAIAD